MELEILEKANKIKERLKKLAWSKENLAYFSKDKSDLSMHIYVGHSSDPFVVPEPLGERVVVLLFDMLDEKINELEKELKEL